MCPEFFLAILYFITILTVNYFLAKLLKSYLANIFQLLKFKNIFTHFKISELLIISNLYFSLKNKTKNTTLFSSLDFLLANEKKKITSDILLIGNIYKFLGTFLTNKKDSLDSNFYFLLLKNQYLSES